ncbi:MAG TPA: peptidoglycan-binding protein [Acidimicrobiales bacterium]|nr:peptidoglycan-binding protein [Acidimicrobiales bacterium]
MTTRLRRTVVALGLIAVGAAGAITAVAGRESGSGQASPAPNPETALVERRDLIATERLSGTIGFGPARAIVAPRGGRLTAHPGAGAVVGQGGVLYEVDGAGVELFLGARPFWRTLAQGATPGPDVRQLEENLVASGTASAAEMTVDDTFTEATASALRRWQRARGWPVTGTLDPSDVAVHATALRVQVVTVALGAVVDAGMPIAQVTSVSEQVSAEVDVHDLELVPAGTEVTVELPNGSQVPGRVASMAVREPNPGDAGGQEPSFLVSITLDIPDDLAREHIPVGVHVAHRRAAGVLTVPVAALLARTGGGYSVQRVLGHGTEVVPVELGVLADGLVEVAGELAPGDSVIVAAA